MQNEQEQNTHCGTRREMTKWGMRSAKSKCWLFGEDGFASSGGCAGVREANFRQQGRSGVYPSSNDAGELAAGPETTRGVTPKDDPIRTTVRAAKERSRRLARRRTRPRIARASHSSCLTALQRSEVPWRTWDRSLSTEKLDCRQMGPDVISYPYTT